MTTPEIIARLEAWATLQKAIAEQYEALQRLTDAGPECALMKPIWKLWAAYTRAVSEQIGDTNEWLQWYELECDMGRKPMEVHSLGGKVVKVRTLRQLARVIAY
jgi:hypothetical protein